MKVQLPLLHQELKDEQLVKTEELIVFDIDTSVYSEERWEQHFPRLAEKEGLFQYVERIQKNSVSDRVKVACMLKALFCFMESERIQTYKEFAQMFVLSDPDYTDRLIGKLKSTFSLILNNSSVKN